MSKFLRTKHYKLKVLLAISATHGSSLLGISILLVARVTNMPPFYVLS